MHFNWTKLWTLQSGRTLLKYTSITTSAPLIDHNASQQIRNESQPREISPRNSSPFSTTKTHLLRVWRRRQFPCLFLSAAPSILLRADISGPQLTSLPPLPSGFHRGCVKTLRQVPRFAGPLCAGVEWMEWSAISP